MGMGSSSTPTPPTLDMGQSSALYEQQLKLQQQYMPSTAYLAGDIARAETTNNLNYGLSLLGDSSIASQYAAAMPTESALRQSLLSQLGAAGSPTAEYNRMQQALGAGTQLRQTEAGQLGDQLAERASQKVALAGRLSPQEEREATQAARAGMAARGLATGSSGLAAELLNRDSYARAREATDLQFAQGVQAADLARRQANTGLAIDTDRFNLGLLQSSAALADAERARQLGFGKDAYNFAMSSNPTMMALGLGSGYANMTQPAMQMVGSAQGLQPMYSGGQFSSGNQGMNMLAGGLGGGLSGAAMGFQVGGPWGAGIGGALGLGAGLLGSAK